jgi:antitoxin ParD1/3/4
MSDKPFQEDPAMPSSYAIGDHFEHFIRQQVEGGRYASASEVVRDALRLLEEEEQRRAAALETLRAEVRKGLASGKGKPAEEVLGRLERKYAKLAAGRSGK